MVFGLLNDDLMSTETERSKEFISNAQKMLRQLNSPSAKENHFLEWLFGKVKKIVVEHGTDKPKRKEMWSQFHKLRSSDDLFQEWKRYLEQMGISAKPVFFQLITAELFEQLLHDTYRSKSTATDDGDDEVILTYEEENAIRYMAGYVVRSLQKKMADEVEMLIETDKKRIQESSSTDWINIIDRGGLIHVTDECYQLFLAIEHATRRELKTEKIGDMNDSFRQHIEMQLNEDNDVLFQWTLITGDETEKEDVLHAITSLWINIRQNSFAKSMMEKYQAETKKRTAKSKSLRTKLFTDQI